MKGLLLKDYYTLIRQMKLFVAFIVFFSFLPGYSTSSFALVYASMMPISALAYDERCKWDSLAVMMPYSSKNIVLSKYILGYIVIFGVFVISVTSQNIFVLIKGIPFDLESILSLLATANVALLIQAVNLPVMFKLGVEKGRFAFFAGIAVIVLIGMFFGERFIEIISGLNFNVALFLAAFMVFVILINLISIRISRYVYEKRDF